MQVENFEDTVDTFASFAVQFCRNSLCGFGIENYKTIIAFKDRAHLSTFKIFIFEKFSCFIVLVVFWLLSNHQNWFLYDFVKNDIFS